MKTWFAVHTQPHSETKALGHLIRQGIEAYLPRYRRRRRHARRTDWIAAPLFPRYLFIAAEGQGLRWRTINSTVGVSGVVFGGDEPARVPPEVIDEIRAREDDQGLVQTLTGAFRAGERVQVLDGPFADLVGLFDCYSDAERVMLLLDFLGRQVRVQVPVASIHAFA